MTLKQLQAIETIKRQGYAAEYSRDENNGIVRVAMPRRWRPGVFYVLIRPDGTYRGSQYTRWDEYLRSVA